MFKQLVALAFLAIAGSHELDRLAGTWNAIASFSNIGYDVVWSSMKNLSNLSVLKLSYVPMNGTFVCLCDGKRVAFPSVKMALEINIVNVIHATLRFHDIPSRIARNASDVPYLVAPFCLCPHLDYLITIEWRPDVYRVVNDNYFLWHSKNTRTRMLFSKLRPSAAELNAVIESDAELKLLNATSTDVFVFGNI